jgi:hypothetical protein
LDTQQILEAWPGAVKEKQEFGSSALFLALQLPRLFNHDESVACATTTSSDVRPYASLSWTEQTDAKELHASVRKHPEQRWVRIHLDYNQRKLTQSYNEALKCTASAAIILAVCEACPNAIKVAANEIDNSGNTSLHYALMNAAPDAVQHALLEENPHLSKMVGEYNTTALHFALANDASEAMTLALLRNWPDATKEASGTYNGRIPLHTALTGWGISDVVVLAVLAAWPDATLPRSQNADEYEDVGEIAFRNALQANASDVVTLAIRDATPCSVVCEVYLAQGPELDLKVFLAWFEAHKEQKDRMWENVGMATNKGGDIKWVEERTLLFREYDGDLYGDYTWLQFALTHNVPDAATLAVRLFFALSGFCNDRITHLLVQCNKHALDPT